MLPYPTSSWSSFNKQRKTTNKYITEKQLLEMKGKRKEESDVTAPWDPLWEYILDDHDDESYLTRKKAPSRSSRRPKETKNESSLLDLFFDNDSEYTDDSRHDYRDEKSNRSKDNKAVVGKRRSQLTEDAGVENSMWDFFSKESKNTPEKIEKSPPLTRAGSGPGRIQTRQIIQVEDESVKSNKKSGLFRRFRKNKDLGSQRTENNKQQVRVTVTQASAPASRTSSMRKTQQQRKEDSMDPFQMFLDVAGRLDPFGSDQDSYTEESGTQDDATELYDLTASGAEMDRLVDEVRCGTPKNEIRLNFKPVGEDSGLDDYFEPIEGAEPISTDLSESSLAAPSPRMISPRVVALSDLDDVKDETPDDVSPVVSDPTFRIFSIDNRKPSECHEATAATPAAAAAPAEQSLPDAKDKAGIQGLGLKRLVCCSVKTYKNVTASTLQPETKMNALPSIPVLSDDVSETPKLVRSNTSTSNGIMRVSSGLLSSTRKPQSFYAYEYSTQEHLDVFYTSMGLKPRSSIVVRKLGGPPPLIPSEMRDEVIVQVDVSTK